MIRHILAAALASAAFVAAPVQAAEFVSGTRLATIASVGPVGQSFVAEEGGLLNSFGFQFGLLNGSQPNSEMVLRLLSGTGLTGAEVATSRATVTGPTNRTPVWFDFGFRDVRLTAGETYTALLSTTSTRLSIAFGPALGSTTDRYADGRLIATVPSSNSFTGCTADATSLCDANFRFTVEPAVAPIPEPATWATMLVGLFGVGYAARRRTRVAFAA